MRSDFFLNKDPNRATKSLPGPTNREHQNLPASRLCLWVRTTVSTVWSVCVCVAISFILDVRLVDAPAVKQEEGRTGFLHLPSAVLALLFIARTIQLSFSLVDREVVFCVCVCVFFPSILDIKFVGRTSRGHTGGSSHRISHPHSFCGACLNFSREKDSAIPFPRRP